LVHLQTPTELERRAYRAAGIVLVGGRHPKEDEQTVAYRRMQPSSIRVHHLVRELV
jgi:hypothetical protein